MTRQSSRAEKAAAPAPDESGPRLSDPGARIVSLADAVATAESARGGVSVAIFYVGCGVRVSGDTLHLHGAETTLAVNRRGLPVEAMAEAVATVLCRRDGTWWALAVHSPGQFSEWYAARGTHQTMEQMLAEHRASIARIIEALPD